MANLREMLKEKALGLYAHVTLCDLDECERLIKLYQDLLDNYDPNDTSFDNQICPMMDMRLNWSTPEEIALQELINDLKSTAIKDFVAHTTRADLITTIKVLIRVDCAMPITICDGFAVDRDCLMRAWSEQHPDKRPVSEIDLCE